LFSDIDGDGRPDLILAIEWGTIRIFLNKDGRFRAQRDVAGLAGLYSRWNGLATGDLDGDGRLDIVATSWGRNIDYHASRARPLYLYAGFLGGGDAPTGVLAQEDPRLKGVAPLPSINWLRLAVPGAGQRL